MTVLTAYYDLAICPVSYDVVTWLVRARMAMQDAGCKALHVVIVPQADGQGGMYRDKSEFFDTEELHWRLWNIVLPACRLARASVTLAPSWQEARALRSRSVWPEGFDRQRLEERPYWFGPIVEAVRKGRRLPLLEASPFARAKVRGRISQQAKGLVTLTLRNASNGHERNSDLQAWRAIEECALRDGYEVMVLRDTYDVLAGGAGFGELNVDLRLACYAEAKMNFHGNGGPARLCWFSAAPFVEFAGYGLEGWFRRHGMAAGEQLPWASGYQRIAFETATPASTVKEYARWAGATS